MTQTAAIFLDAYRSLNAKKMFWGVLAFSVLVVAAFALVSINNQGLKIAIWQFDNEMFNSQVVSPATFYKLVFVKIGIGFWLSWIATALALISTAGIFPDLMTSGSIDLLCAKPIGRLRLFATQYVAGLLFVTLQVAVFCLASFMVLGLCGGTWESGLFVAIPLIVCFFSYLFAASVFFGVATRSTLPALLLTLLFWFGLYLLSTAEQTLLMFRTMEEEKVEWVDMQRPHRWNPKSDRPPVQTAENPAVPPAEAPPADTRSPDAPPAANPAGHNSPDEARLDQSRVLRALRKTLVKAVTAEPDARQDANVGKTLASESHVPNNSPTSEQPEEPSDFSKIAVAHNIVYGVKTILPKTSETITLLERELISRAELPGNGGTRPRDRVARKIQTTLRSRSITWIVGTSLAFELVVLGAAAWIFCRRDY